MSCLKDKDTALLVIDMQRGFLEPRSPLFIDGAPASVPACAAVIAACRKKGVPVFFVTRAYAAQRYLTACAGRGRLPIRFNGSIFTISHKGDPDYRRWGKIFDGMTESNRKPEEGEYQLALIDTVIAAQNAVIAAEGLGLSSVYLGDIMEHYEDRAEALGCPAGVVPCLSLCIGYATEGQLERAPIRRYQQKYLIHEGQYQDFERDELLEMLRDRGQYETMEDMAPWLERFSKRSVEGKGALERTRSIREAIRKMQEI